PDTIWFPDDGLCALPDAGLSFLLFPVERPEFFDAVVSDDAGRIIEIQVKQRDARSNWIWGALKMPGTVFRELFELWKQRDCRDEYLGTLVNAYLRSGHEATGVRAGQSYVDIGTLHGYRAAISLLSGMGREPGAPATLKPAKMVQNTAPDKKTGLKRSVLFEQA